jgi:hypothetical protein
MVACDSTLQHLAWEAESSWGENVTTMTYGVRINAPVDVSGITQAMLAPERVETRRLAGSKGIPGLFTPSFSFSVYLTGHGTDTSGATTQTDLYRLIGAAIGGSAVAAAAGSTFTGGTVTVPTTTASGTFSAGGMMKAGGLADGTGNGQFYAIATHATTNMTLLNDLVSSSLNGVVLRSADLAYAADSSCSLTGHRFRIQTSDGQWVVHGCYPTAFGITGLNPGEVPKLTFTWAGSWAQPIATTFPTTPTADTFTPSPNAADGSCFFNTVGTTTRALISLRQFSVDYQLGVAPVMGGAGVSTYQAVTGATRTTDLITVNATVDAAGADATPTYWDEWLANTAKHLLYTLNSKDGQSVGLYFRNLCYTGNRPSQNETSGRNTIPLSFMAYAGSTTTSDLTLSPLVIAGA